MNGNIIVYTNINNNDNDDGGGVQGGGWGMGGVRPGFYWEYV